MEALRLAGIEFEVVPGIAAALGAAASMRIKIVFLSNHLCQRRPYLIGRVSSPTIGPNAGP